MIKQLKFETYESNQRLYSTKAFTNQRLFRRVGARDDFCLKNLRVFAIVFLPENNLASAVLFDYSISVWSPTTGVLVTQLTESTPSNRAFLLISSNTLVTACFDYNICIWNLKTGELTKVLTEHTNALLSGNTLASGSFDKTGCIWDITSVKTIKVLTGFIDNYI